MAEYPQAGQPGRPALHFELTAGIFKFKIIAGTAEIASELIGKAPFVAVAGGAAIGLTLAAIYKFPECRPIIRDVLVAAFCCRVTRNAQEIGQITPGCISFDLRCFTKNRFLEILSDYKSGKIEQRLKEEFLKVGIKTTGLQVKIENMEEVEETKAAIEQGYEK